MAERCNQLVQCRDKSDEDDCKLLLLKKSYNKRVPPTLTSGQNVTPASVKISITLMQIIAIKEVDHKLVLKFGIQLNWFENRAKFHNLKEKTPLNALSDIEVRSQNVPIINKI